MKCVARMCRVCGGVVERWFRCGGVDDVIDCGCEFYMVLHVLLFCLLFMCV